MLNIRKDILKYSTSYIVTSLLLCSSSLLLIIILYYSLTLNEGSVGPENRSRGDGSNRRYALNYQGNRSHVFSNNQPRLRGGNHQCRQGGEQGGNKDRDVGGEGGSERSGGGRGDRIRPRYRRPQFNKEAPPASSGKYYRCYFWHITDIHYDVSYSTKGDPRKNCWKINGVPNRRPGTFGDYNCDSPWALVESAAKAMRAKHGDNVEFVLWTGDGLSGTASGRSSDMQVLALQNLTYLLSKTFPSQFVFPVLGHNDPGSSPGERLGYKDVGQFWRQWLPTEAIQTFNKGGYYTFEQKDHKLRIVALNTNLYSGLYTAEDPLGQWAWLESVLIKSHSKKETVYLVGHMAPGADERQPDALPHFQENYSRRLLRLIRKYSDIIVGQFFGHLHSDTFRVVYNDMDRPVNWMLLAPALSPKRTASGPNNPGIRLYKFETSTGQVLDYTQYYLDLNNANQRDSADWQQEYNLTSYYGLTEVTAKSLNELASTFTKHNSQLFSRYYEANSVRLYGSPQAGGCDASCAQTHFCAITRVEYSEFRHCLEAAASALASPASMPLVTSVPVVIISQLLAYYMSVT